MRREASNGTAKASARARARRRAAGIIQGYMVYYAGAMAFIVTPVALSMTKTIGPRLGDQGEHRHKTNLTQT